MPGRPVDEGGGGESHVAHQMASNFTQLSVELHDAAEAGEVQGISSGLSKGCTCIKVDQKREQAMRSSPPCTGVVDISASCDVNSRDPSLRGRTALHIGCSNSHLEVVRELIRSNADPTLAMDGGWVPAHCAAEAGALSCLREIHRKTPRAVQLADDHGDIPLDVAQTYKREECIKFLEEVEAASLKAFEAGDVEGDP